MKKLITITLLSAAAMLAAPKAQNTTAPATPVKKVHKKHSVKKAKTAVAPAPSATPAK